MATIRRRNKKWQVQVRRLHYGSLSQTFTHKKDALQWAREKEVELQKRSLKLQSGKFPLLKNLIEKYIKTISINKKGYNFEKYCFNNILRSKVSDLPINFITTQHLSEYRDERLKRVKYSTFVRELNLIRHLFTVAIKEWGFAISNPCKMIIKQNGIYKRERRLTNTEYNFLVKGNYPQVKLRMIIELALETAMRRGEILNIKPEHIKGQTLLIPETKNNHSRTIPLTKRALYILENTELPFSMSANAVRLAWERLKKKGGVNNLHFHDLRHEAISKLFEKCLSIPEVALISGHKDIRMLFRYTHLKAEDILKKF
jgi:integrase